MAKKKQEAKLKEPVRIRSCFRHFLGIKSYCVYSQRLR